MSQQKNLYRMQVQNIDESATTSKILWKQEKKRKTLPSLQLEYLFQTSIFVPKAAAAPSLLLQGLCLHGRQKIKIKCRKAKLKLTLCSKYISIHYCISPNQGHPRLNVVIKEGLVLKAWLGQKQAYAIGSLSLAHAHLQTAPFLFAVTSSPSLQLSGVSLSLLHFSLSWKQING